MEALAYVGACVTNSDRDRERKAPLFLLAPFFALPFFGSRI